LLKGGADTTLSRVGVMVILGGLSPDLGLASSFNPTRHHALAWRVSHRASPRAPFFVFYCTCCLFCSLTCPGRLQLGFVFFPLVVKVTLYLCQNKLKKWRCRNIDLYFDQSMKSINLMLASPFWFHCWRTRGSNIQ